MAVAELPRPPIAPSGRPTVGHMLWNGIVATLTAMAALWLLAFVAWALPGNGEVVLSRVLQVRPAFEGWLPRVGEAVVLAALFGSALWFFVRSQSGHCPAFFWTVLSAFAGAWILVGGGHGTAAWVVALIGTSQLGFDRDGRPRVSPVRPAAPVVAAAWALILIAVALVVAGAIGEPLVRHASGYPQARLSRLQPADRSGLPAGTAQLRVWLQNRGPRTITVTGATAAGVQVVGLRRELTAFPPDGRMLGPFVPVRMRPDADGFVTMLVRPGCRTVSFHGPVDLRVTYLAGTRTHTTGVSIPKLTGGRC